MMPYDQKMMVLLGAFYGGCLMSAINGSVLVLYNEPAVKLDVVIDDTLFENKFLDTNNIQNIMNTILVPVTVADVNTYDE